VTEHEGKDAMRTNARTALHWLGSEDDSRLRRGGAALLAGFVIALAVDLIVSGASAAGLRVPPVGVNLTVATLLGVALGVALSTRHARAIDAGTAGIAHDLRAPLLTTRSMLDLLSSGAFGQLTTEGRDAVQRAALAAARANALVDSLLHEHAGAGATRAPRAAVPVDLQAVADRVIASFEPGLEERGARVSATSLPAVLADELAVERILQNLLENALTHASSDAPVVELTARRRGPTWEVAVRDNGEGVPDHLRDRVFEPGVRAPAATSRPGFGLGLATVRRLVEDMGGKAWVDPATREGACIRFTLPAR
jgi:signal transduction histidine kinase